MPTSSHAFLPFSQESKPVVKKNSHSRPANFVIAVKPQTKKAKTEVTSEKPPSGQSNGDWRDEKTTVSANSMLGSLVSYSDESEDDD